METERHDVSFEDAVDFSSKCLRRGDYLVVKRRIGVGGLFRHECQRLVLSFD
jgi:hypothetical protein